MQVFNSSWKDLISNKYSEKPVSILATEFPDTSWDSE